MKSLFLYSSCFIPLNFNIANNTITVTVTASIIKTDELRVPLHWQSICSN